MYNVYTDELPDMNVDFNFDNNKAPNHSDVYLTSFPCPVFPAQLKYILF